ncbi:DUF134 domain-containing protein [Gehongia tenuis]|uniref:DUF134 domain-containing protein n=1 Tax=Gehongia tenuis TaxID=2763655 RepID=A0A926D5D1_9FIRM|nr:DUF134 domain-containing protein [Gehongia tenuis]
MARPPKCRRVCRMPCRARFGPLDGEAGEEIRLTVDEYEAVRLIDLAGLSQEEAAGQMGVARTTVQGIYDRARRKLADFLVNGRGLAIHGGEYRLCGRCPHYGKEHDFMKIAVASMGQEVSPHFGHCENFNLYDPEAKTWENLPSPGHQCGFLPTFLKNAGAGVVIAGGMGRGAQENCRRAGLEVITGASGSAKAAVERYLAGELVSTGAVCDHDHDHEGGHHHGEGHECHGHGEGHACHGHGEGHECHGHGGHSGQA